MNFRERLQQAAKWAGVGDSQSSIASSLRLNRQTINRWFQGGEPNAELLLHVARSWGVDAEWLKSGKGDMLPPADELPTDEMELLRDYRKASMQTRQQIRTMVRALRKSMIAIAMVVPPLLAPHQDANAGTLHKSFFEASVIRIVRRWLSTLQQALSACLGSLSPSPRFAM